ncbi:sigma-70 family RNA polymerase sigma factor [Rhodocaloribacter litoris]|uniref:ECF-type sigma factor n=1 Tax=Rhodocaloribacter litoris TaxID=2558931 RepID=UPI00142029A6|nr:ECF-type sigma factor [Rhodocaloribacter litoris]QXD17104.1 sigma-70 family RNA polymerase sigma factor [Rhodocaloribacter litoris]
MAESVTALLQAAREGDTRAFDALYETIYEELRRLAHRVRSGRGDVTLSTTGLVHEAYLHLIPSKDLNWQDRTHFFRVAARAMRQVLVREARRRKALKRGGGVLTVTFDDRVHAAVDEDDLLMLDEALSRLEALDTRQARVVECRFFGGLTIEETAEALGVGTATVKRDWRVARAYLVRALAS